MNEETKTFLGELRLSGCEIRHLSEGLWTDGYHYVVYRDPSDTQGFHFMRVHDDYNVFFLNGEGDQRNLEDKRFNTFEDMAGYLGELVRDG